MTVAVVANLNEIMNEEAIIIFVRNPVLGSVKTRIAAKLGEEAALNVYHKLLEHTHQVVLPLHADKFVFYADGINENDIWENGFFKKQQQVAGDLGFKMQHAFETLFIKGYQRILVIGSDCYDLTTAHIFKAFEALKKNEVVIGPAVDGGYYLLGMKKMIPSLFHNIHWSTATVLQQTIEACETEKAMYATLQTLSDVDEAENINFQY